MKEVGIVAAPRERIDNSQLLKDNPDLRVRHFHRVGNSRSFTIAYREGHSTIEIATAVVNPADCFCKKVGTKLAIEHFLAGKITIVPKLLEVDYNDPRRLVPASAAWTLTSMFAL